MNVIPFPRGVVKDKASDNARKIVNRMKSAIGDEPIEDVVEALTDMITVAAMAAAKDKVEAHEIAETIHVCMQLNIGNDYERFLRFLKTGMN